MTYWVYTDFWVLTQQHSQKYDELYIITEVCNYKGTSDAPLAPSLWLGSSLNNLRTVPSTVKNEMNKRG